MPTWARVTQLAQLWPGCKTYGLITADMTDVALPSSAPQQRPAKRSLQQAPGLHSERVKMKQLKAKATKLSQLCNIASSKEQQATVKKQPAELR